MSAFTAIAQIGLSFATLAIAFAVYRIQADKLFLDMRDKRNEALDRFADAAVASMLSIGNLTLDQIGEEYQPWSNLERAKDGILTWFGAEVSADADRVRTCLEAAHDAKLHCLGPATPSNLGKHREVARLCIAAAEMVGEMRDKARPYIEAGRRGLPVAARLRLRRR